MSVRRRGPVIEVSGACPAEDAESLLQLYLSMDDDPIVDWAECEAAHGAVIQLLLALPPGRLRGAPRGAFLRQMAAPALASAPLGGFSREGFSATRRPKT
jgi:hypothetical protein